MIDCDKSVEIKDSRKVVNGKKSMKRGKTGRKERQGCETFQSLCITSPTHTCTTAGLECRHLPLQVRPSNCYY